MFCTNPQFLVLNNLYIQYEIAIETKRTGIKINQCIRKIDSVCSKDSISFWGMLEQLEKSCVRSFKNGMLFVVILVLFTLEGDHRRAGQ